MKITEIEYRVLLVRDACKDITSFERSNVNLLIPPRVLRLFTYAICLGLCGSLRANNLARSSWFALISLP